ncbi:hypothetical protein MK489_08770 [Myxococcota bacterium]|nr:hypothetical protein [Myxococcota bacterium]
MTVIALGIQVGTALETARELDMRLPVLGAFYDASLYIEIAKSFPLPYSSDGRDYLGHAPGYPALIALLRGITPDGWRHWGMLALLASWLPAALAAGVFCLLCREVGLEPFWPSLAFAAANPRWLSVTSTVHAEPLAMLALLLAVLACLRGRVGVSVLWLSVAGLTRFPALLVGVAIAYAVLIQQRRWSLRNVAYLSVPLLAFGGLNLYLAWRIPGFEGIAESHRVFWETHLTWPFHAYTLNLMSWFGGKSIPALGLTTVTLMFFLASLGAALRSGDRRSHFLGIWVTVTTLFHLSLAGEWGGFDFARLAVLAWPAALLLVWREWIAARPRSIVAGLTLVSAMAGIVFAIGILTESVRWQGASSPAPAHTAHGFGIDTPRWFDFRGLYGEPRRQGEP